MQVLVTGGAGFIGSNYVRFTLERHPEDHIFVIDLLTYAGNLENLAGLEANPRFHFHQGDICNPEPLGQILKSGIDAIVNFAAESHVDRSILDASEFARTNIVGTLNLLQAARKAGVGRFLQISTDEVYGSLGPAGAFTETTPLAPNSPYAASKAAADLFVRSYTRTYGFPGMITRCSNNYGPYQFPEKLIPLLITNAMNGMALPLYGDGLHTRDWIHVHDHCAAVDLVLRRGRGGEVYNIGARQEQTNLGIARWIVQALGKDEGLISFVDDRPGHDRRYAIDPSKVEEELEWKPAIELEEGLRSTLDWYMQNPAWVEHVRSGAYRKYYERMYKDRGRTLAEL